MPQLPTGTVTFVFSDIEGSTRLLGVHGAAWSGVLGRHLEILRGAYAPRGAHEVGTEGDSLFAVFPSAAEAVAAVAEAQRALAAEAWPADEPLRVRIGMHSGLASIGVDTYVGLDVHRAARIAAAGHGGQVLLSDATRALVEQALPDGVALRDLGEHRLKDLAHPERLWQLVIDGLPDAFPALASLDATPNNLPTRLTRFLGRETEIAAIGALLGGTRILTLSGPGGTGKTRLALEVATRRLADYPDGAWWVELTPIREPELVVPTIAKALGLPDRGGRAAIDRLVDHLAERTALLVLDNFEQVSDAAPDIAELANRCPMLTVLTTSRSILRIYGEREFPVPPLGLPDPAHLPPDVATLSQYEAVALFIDRATAVKPDFAVTNENAPAVAEICVRLDGLPLAIELAAARVRLLTPQAILPRLADRLGLLSAGARDLPERQQTLRGAIAWSHDLLDEPERALFACLAVFVGGADLAAVELVCRGHVTGDVLDTLASLVDKSLVRQWEGIDAEPRFGMLETIREYALEQAVERDAWDGLRDTHAALFADRAAEAAARVMEPDKRSLLDRFEEDHDNLRAAISWSVERRDAATAQRLLAACWRFWQMRGYLPEGADRARAVLEMPGAADHPELHAAALDAAAGIAYWQADLERSRSLYEREIALRRELGDRSGLAWALYSISFTYALGASEEDSATATRYTDEALEIFTELGDRLGVGRAVWAQANQEHGVGDPRRAIELARETIPIFEELDDRFMLGWATYTLGIANLALLHQGATDPGLLDEARRWMTEALRIFVEAGDVSGYTLVLDSFADIARRTGDRERAAAIAGAVASLERTSGTGLALSNRPLVGYDPEALRDDPALVAAWARGEGLTKDDAVALALGDDRP